MISGEFVNNLEKLLKGDKLVASKPLVVGRPSNILALCGANPGQDITITKSVIDKALRPEIRNEEGRLVGNTGHGLTVELIVKSIYELDSPTMIFRGRQEGALLIVLSVLDQKGRNIVVAIEFDRTERFTKVNSIRSIYGRDNLSYYIGENISKGNLLAAKKEKADELLRSMGKSYPEENTFISFK